MLLKHTKSGLTSPHHVEVSSPRLDTSLAAREADKAAAPNTPGPHLSAVPGGEPSTPSSEADGAKTAAFAAPLDREHVCINSEQAAKPFHNRRQKSWWYRASTEERLAQIDGCIAVGMTAVQCAINCGAEYGSMTMFANRKGRYFGTGNYSEARAAAGRNTANRFHSLKRAKKAYLAGEPVDFWGAE